jgi:hypothetical protein
MLQGIFSQSFQHHQPFCISFGTIHDMMTEIRNSTSFIMIGFNIRSLSWIFLFFGLVACSGMEGTQVKSPFSGKKYLSDAKHFRAVGMGQSSNLNIAKSKADIEAKKALAQQVQTNLKVVTDNYASELVGNQASEAIERFQTLSREVTNTTIGDIRGLGEEIRQSENGTYTAYVAIEIRKKAMFRFLKDKAKSDAKISELVRSQMVTLCEKELERLEEIDPD